MYRGELRPRRFALAMMANLALPGLGYVYCGRFRTGLVLTLWTVLPVVTLLVGGWVAGVFLVKPVVLALGLLFWLHLGMATDLWRVCRYAGPDYVLKPVNHFAVYLAILLVFGLPLALLGSFTASRVVGTVEIADRAMFPRLVPGDRLYFDRRAFERRPPVRGELVVAVLPGEGRPRVLRVVGTPGDEVSVSGVTVAVDGQPLSSSPFARVRLDPPLAAASDGRELAATTELSPDTDQHYAVFHGLDVASRDRFGPVRLGDDRYFLMADYRDGASVTDSRTVGAVDGSSILGAPRHVFWSYDDRLGWRWERVGLSPRSVDHPAPESRR